METTDIESLKYPVGKFHDPAIYTENLIRTWILIIEQLPAKLRTEVHGLNESAFDTPYRDGGWTIRQVVHHLPDCHMNAYIRFKLGLTEDMPTIRPYLEARWAELDDSKKAPVEMSLVLLESLHKRWVYFLKTVKPADWKRKYYHPESKREFELHNGLALYAWHCDHHLAHITQLKKRMGW